MVFLRGPSITGGHALPLHLNVETSKSTTGEIFDSSHSAEACGWAEVFSSRTRHSILPGKGEGRMWHQPLPSGKTASRDLYSSNSVAVTQAKVNPYIVAT